jgi:predicted metal-dependent hydrolase
LIKIDKLIRSARKSIALIVQRDGQLIVRAPYQATDEQIQAFINLKSSWVLRKQNEVQQKTSHVGPRKFESGEAFLYLGESYPLAITEKAAPLLEQKVGQFRLARRAQARAKDLLTAWYKKQARQVLEARVHIYAARYHLSYKRIRISSARTRWGSCSTTGTISFTWRLVMAPLPVIDYVVVHELAHTKEKNHAKRFWDTVAAMMPDYQKHRKWLKENGHLLNLD